jgi:hypothetical protein
MKKPNFELRHLTNLLEGLPNIRHEAKFKPHYREETTNLIHY